jgi:uncharacterized repeat protein (TIGR02543 family)
LDYSDKPSFTKSDETRFGFDVSMLDELDDPKYKPSTDITPYHKVTFVSNEDGEDRVIHSQSVRFNGRATRPDAPSRYGYTFVDWYRDSGMIYDFSSPILDDITLYAKWNPSLYYNVTFNSNGGSAVPSQRVFVDDLVTEPVTPTRSDGYMFAGWYSNSGLTTTYDFSTPVTKNITLYAKWTPGGNEWGDTLEKKLAWLQTYAVTGGKYVLEVNANESISPHTLSYTNRPNISITLIGTGGVRTVSLKTGSSYNGSIFTVGSGVTLTLDNYVTLKGRSNNKSLVTVNSGGTLVMKNGSAITGNTTSTTGGAAYVGGTFTMNGGEISGNTSTIGSSTGGGGVFVAANGTFTMNDGKIKNNTSTIGNGGGVFVADNGTFTMSGGEISNNTTPSNASGNGYGSGVNVVGTFTMKGGKISGNTANYGGGVHP